MRKIIKYVVFVYMTNSDIRRYLEKKTEWDMIYLTPYVCIVTFSQIDALIHFNEPLGFEVMMRYDDMCIRQQLSESLIKEISSEEHLEIVIDVTFGNMIKHIQKHLEKEFKDILNDDN